MYHFVSCVEGGGCPQHDNEGLVVERSIRTVKQGLQGFERTNHDLNPSVSAEASHAKYLYICLFYPSMVGYRLLFFEGESAWESTH